MTTYQLRKGPKGKIIDIGQPIHSSNESKGIWRRPGSSTQTWKIYVNSATFSTALTAFTRADHEGLPVPAFQGIRGFQFWESNNAVWKDAYILQTVLLGGTFFAMSQAGQKSKWKGWLRTLDRSKDRAVLHVAQTAAHTASRISVLDPQGFLDKSRREPVMFIDLHLGSSKPGSSTGAEQMREEIDAYINGVTETDPIG